MILFLGIRILVKDQININIYTKLRYLSYAYFFIIGRLCYWVIIFINLRSLLVDRNFYIFCFGFMKQSYQCCGIYRLIGELVTSLDEF